MNNISFKAKLQGIGDRQKRIEFESRTANDHNKYKMTYLYKDPNTNWDIFELSDNNKETIKYANIKNSKNNPNDYKIEELLKIYNILRIKKALKVIEHIKKEKINMDFNNYMAELDKNEGIDSDVHIIGANDEE